MSTYEEARDAVLAKRELDEKLAAAREEQRETCCRAIAATAGTQPGAEVATALQSCAAAFLDATPLADCIAGLRADLREQKADLEQAAKVTEELVDGLAEETRKRQAAEAELAKVRAALQAALPVLEADVEDMEERVADWPEAVDGPPALASCRARLEQAKAALGL